LFGNILSVCNITAVYRNYSNHLLCRTL
jgi:hypothetical protein